MQRLDLETVRRGIFPGRDRAQEEIRKGLVSVNGRVIDKPSHRVGEEDDVVYAGGHIPVSRAALKLEKALTEFSITVSGRQCIDVGASTGGFVEVLLKEGAEGVTAVDVGHGQLHETLKDDGRVTNVEGFNFRYADGDSFPHDFDFLTMDVSFISIGLMTDAVRSVLKPGGEGVILIKPQFEAGKKALGGKGVVGDWKDRLEVLKKVIAAYEEKDMSIVGITASPIKGPEGNTEYLMHIVNGTIGGYRSPLENESMLKELALGTEEN